MGASLDSLEVKISADASKAARSLTELKTALSGLNTALAPAAKGLDSMVLSLSKVVGMQSGLTNISKTFGSLAKSWTALNQSTNKSAAEMAGISDKARTMSQVFAKEYGIKGKESVGELTNAFQKLYSSIGDNAAMGKALSNIETIIRKYAQLKGEVTEAGNVIKETLRNTTVKLPSTLTKELGSSLINSMSKLSHVSGTEGSLPSEIVKEINAALDPERLLGVDKDYSAGFIDITGIDNEAQILEKLVAALRDAEGQTMTFAEASRQNQDVVNKLAEQLNNLATSVGTTFEGSISSYKDAIYQMMEVSPELARQLMSVDTAIDNIANNGNPFEGVLSGLTQLQDIHLSDSLNNITAIKDAMGKFGGENATRAAANLPGIASALRQFDGVTIPPIGEDVMNLAAGLSKLGGKKIADGFTNLENIKASLMGINNLKIDPAVTQSIYQLAEGLYKFGLAKMDKAVSTIPALAGSITQLVNSLSSLPAVSENTIRLISALGNVNVHANTAANTMGGRLSRGLKLYTGNAFNARKASMSLAQAFGKMYANFFIFFRLARQFKNDIDLASDLTEVQNVVDVTFGDMADKMNEFSKAAIDSLGMSELTAKRVGSRFQAMGTAMSISDSMVKSTNDFVQKATNGYADVADSMADVSINLTRLAGDMASFYNADYKDVAEDLEAVFTGLSKPLRKYGVDLTAASISSWALSHGMEVNMKTMTQAEKTLLRYQYVMAQTTAAHGDFERTQSTWANQIRIATERLNQLRIVLGKIAIYTFKPLVQSFNKAMEQIIKGAEGLLNSLGKIFGWQIEWNDGGILNEEADDSEELADNMGDAADNAKKFKNFLLGIDELNVLPSNDDKDKGKGSGLGDLGGLGDATGGFNIRPVEKGFDSIYDTLFKLGARINEIIKELLQKIDWDKVYKKARAFGTGLADFLNGLLLDSETFYEIGKFIANGINTVAHAIDAFHKRFNGLKLGVDIGYLFNGFMENLDWDVIKSAAYEKAHDLAQTINGAFGTIKWDLVGKTIAEGFNTVIEYFYTLGSEINWKLVGDSLAKGINSLFKNFDFAKAAETVNAWAKGFLDFIITALGNTDWKQVGTKIGEFIVSIDFIEIATKVVKAFWNALDGIFSTYQGILETAPFETAIGTVITSLFASKTLSKLVLKNIKKWGKGIAGDLTSLFKGDLLSKFMTGFLGGENLVNIKDAGNIFTDLKNGVNAVSGSLDTATKALGGFTVGFAEFTSIKNSVYDIVTGTDDIGKSIRNIVGAASLAGVAMTALLGFPAGLIATAVVGLGAGLTGVITGFVDSQKEIFNSAVVEALTVPDGANLYDYMTDLTKTISNMAGEYNELSKKGNVISDLKDNIGKNMDEIEQSIQKIDLSLKAQIEVLPEDIATVVGLFNGLNDDLRSVLSESYDIIVAGLAGWDDEMVDAFGASKPEILATVSGIGNDIQKELDNLTSQMSELQSKFDAGEITATEFTNSFIPLLERQNELRTSLGLTEDSLTDLENTVDGIDLSTMFTVGADGALELSQEFMANSEALRHAYDERVQAIETGGQNEIDAYNRYLANAKTIDDRNTLLDAITISETRMNMKKEESVSAIAGFYDGVQKELLNGYESVIESAKTAYQTDPFASLKYSSESDAVRTFVLAYQRETIEPTVAYIQQLWGDALGEETINADEISKNILDSLFFVDDSSYVLRNDYKDILASKLSELPSVSYEYGKETSKALADGMNTAETSKKISEDFGKIGGVIGKHDKNLDGSKSKWAEWSKETEKSAKTSSASLGGIERAMLSVKDTSSLAFSTMTDFSKVVGEVGKSGEGINQISTSFGSLGTLIQGMAQNFIPLKTEFSTFTTDTQMNMQKTTSIFGESFTSIMKYGNQTISWLKGSFVPYFSGAYWNGITSSIPNAFGNAFRQAINIMMNLWKQFATWANQNMKMKVNMRGKEVTGVDVEIPQYATGGFPEDGLFQANHSEMVGQFANGKTAVANNEQIVEGIRQGVYDAVKAAMAENGSGNVTVELAGDASDIFTAVVKENNRAIYRTGTSPIRN